MAVLHPQRRMRAYIASRAGRLKSISKAIQHAMDAVPIYCAEALERRVLLSVVAPGIPFWRSVGPGPLDGGGVNIPDQQNAGSGSINAVATSPTHEKTVFVATTAGGIWRTLDATSINPIWTPLTDQYAWSDTTCVAFDTFDPSENTIWGGLGFSSSLNADSAPDLGVILSTDAGAHWSLMGSGTLAGTEIVAVAPTTVKDPTTGQQIVMAADLNGTGGIWRSVNGGVTFTRVAALPTGGASDLIGDPGNPQRFYAALTSSGVYRTDDAGATWTNTLIPGIDANMQGLRLSASSVGAGSDVFAILVKNNVPDAGSTLGTRATNVFHYKPGIGWSEVLNLPNLSPLGQGNIAIKADPSHSDMIYVAGDTGGVWQGKVSTSSWVRVEGANAGGTSVHSDNRDLEFDANGDLWNTSDGGVFRLVNPNNAGPPAPARRWYTESGNIANNETTGVQLDRVNDIVFGGFWDTGNAEQNSPGTSTFTDFQFGDGGNAQVDNSSLIQTVRYSNISASSGVPQLKTIRRRTFNSANALLTNEGVELASSPGGALYSGLTAADNAPAFLGGGFLVNKVAPQRMLVTGAGTLYESMDQGRSITNITIPGQPSQGNMLSTAYGGRFGGVDAPGVAYIAFDKSLYLRTADGLPFNAVTLPSGADLSGISLNRRVVVDPLDWHIVYLLDSHFRSTAISHVWRSNSAGAAGSWTEITGNINALQNANGGSYNALYAMECVHIASQNVLLISAQGGVYRLVNPDTNVSWSEYGTHLPNVAVDVLSYYPAGPGGKGGDELIAGTLGRSVWVMDKASTTLSAGAGVTLTGSAGDDTYYVVRDGSRLNITESLGGGPPTTYSYEFDAITGITLNTLGGNDSVTLDYGNGNVAPPGGFGYFGGNGDDRLFVLGSAESDLITMDTSHVNANNNPATTYFDVEHVALEGRAGDDFIHLDSSNAFVTLIGGDGDDRIDIASPGGNLDQVPAAASVLGSSGNDRLFLHDQNNIFPDTFTWTNSNISRPFFDGVSYTLDLESITLDAGAGSSTFNVLSTMLGTTNTINAGGGSDAVILSPTEQNVTNSFGGPVIVNGGGNSGGGSGDTITINDQLTTADDNWTVTSTTVNKANVLFPPLLTYSNLQAVTINGGSGSTGYSVLSSTAGILVTLNTGAGNDITEIGLSGAGSLSDLAGPISIDGQGGNNNLFINDNLTTAAHDWNIGASIVTRSSTGAISFANMSNLVIFGGSASPGSGGNIFFVSGVGAATTNIIAGNQDDFVTVGASALAAPLSSPLIFDGGAGHDTIVLNDSASTVNGAYAISGSQMTRLGSAPISYSNIEGVALRAGSGNDAVTITGTGAGASVYVEGGNGSDSLTVQGAGLNSDVSFVGGNPTAAPGDSLIVNGGGLSGMYRPSSTIAGDGVVIEGTHNITFTGLEPVTVNGFSSFTLQPQNSVNQLAITSDGTGHNTASGTSGGIAFESLTWSNVISFILDLTAHDAAPGGSKDDKVSIDSPGLSVPIGSSFLFEGGSGNDKLIVNAGSLTLDQDVQLHTSSLSLFVNTGAAVHFNSDQHLAGLTLTNGGSANVPTGPRRQFDIALLSIDGTSLFDIGNSALLLDNTATPFATFQSYWRAGYNITPDGFGNYDGTHGITSSVAIADNTTTGTGTLKHQIGYINGNVQTIYGFTMADIGAPAIATNRILVRPVLMGDINFDGVVGPDDIQVILGTNKYNAGPGTATDGWFDGDFNGDGQANPDDIQLLLGAETFNNGSYGPKQASAVAAATPARSASATVITASAQPQQIKPLPPHLGESSVPPRSIGKIGAAPPLISKPRNPLSSDAHQPWFSQISVPVSTDKRGADSVLNGSNPRNPFSSRRRTPSALRKLFADTAL